MAWAITFEGVDATLFNFYADLLGVAFQAIFAFAIAHAFVYLMSSHLRKGHPIPTKLLGTIPSNFVSSIHFACLLKLSGPVLALALLLALSDFSHSIADLGLSFVTVETEGPSETVLSLDQRNPTRLLELSGDPTSPRTQALADSASTLEKDLSQARLDARLIRNFLVAIDDIAGGGSLLANYTEAAQTDLKYHGADVLTYFGHNHEPLSQISRFLPLDCSSSSMATIAQSIFGLPDIKPRFNPLRNTASLASCSYNRPRSSGVYDSSSSSKNDKNAKILEYATIPFPAENVTLIQNGALVQNISLSPADQLLARDRDNWKKGRDVSNINGIQIGDLSIQFGTTVLATGDFAQPQFLNVSDTIQLGLGTNAVATGLNQPEILIVDGAVQFLLTRHYFLVSNVVEECPPLPSGKTFQDLECMVFSEILCEPALEEDIEPFILSDFADLEDDPLFQFIPKEDSFCSIHTGHLVWGQNFVVDDELLAVTSAVLTRAQVNSWKAHGVRDAMQNCVLAAMFALATTTEMPSLQSQVRAQVNVIFVLFMILPLLVTALIFVVTLGSSKLPIPVEGWQLMVLGREEESVPTRKESERDFPTAASKEYEFALRQDDSTRALGGERLGIHRAATKQSVQDTNHIDSNEDGFSTDDRVSLADIEVETDYANPRVVSGGNLGQSAETLNDPPGKDVQQGVSVIAGTGSLPIP